MRTSRFIGILCLLEFLTVQYSNIYSTELQKVVSQREFENRIDHLLIGVGTIRRWDHEDGFGQVILERAGESFFVLTLRVRRVVALGERGDKNSFVTKKPTEFLLPEGGYDEKSLISFLPQFRIDLVFDVSNAFRSVFAGDDCIESEHYFVFLLRDTEGVLHVKSLIEDYSESFEGNWIERQ